MKDVKPLKTDAFKYDDNLYYYGGVKWITITRMNSGTLKLVITHFAPWLFPRQITSFIKELGSTTYFPQIKGVDPYAAEN